MSTVATVQSFIDGRWIGQHGEQLLRSAVNGRPVAATHEERIDFAEAVACARGPRSRAYWRSTSRKRAARLRALAKYLGEHKEELYAVSAYTGATRSDSWIDIEGGIGTLFSYASIGSRELPSGNVLHEGPRFRSARGRLCRYPHSGQPTRPRGAHQCLQFPSLGACSRNSRRAFSPACPAS